MGKVRALLIEEDDDIRPTLRHNLRGDGYEVLLAVEEESALAWVTGC
jgi:DNA-binding response OmpR family regulator